MTDFYRKVNKFSQKFAKCDPCLSKIAKFESDLVKTNEDLAPQSGHGNFTDVFLVGGKFPTSYKRLQTLRHYISSLA